jgi:hypothetical protein
MSIHKLALDLTSFRELSSEPDRPLYKRPRTIPVKTSFCSGLHRDYSCFGQADGSSGRRDAALTRLRIGSLADVMLKVIYRSIFHFLNICVMNMISDELETK